MKKKILVVSIAVALLAVLAVSGSLAWFTDDDSVTNTFAVGSIKIEQIEQQRVEDADGNKTADLEAFVDDKVLMPVVAADAAQDPNYLDKIVTVKSNGENPAYVRTHIAIPTALVGTLKLDISDSTKWVAATTYETQIEVGEMDYTVYSFTYTQALNKTDVTDVLLEGVYIDAKTDLKDNPDTTEEDLEFCYYDETTQKYVFTGYVAWKADGTASEKVNVLVATQGVQSQGFNDAQTALNTAFATIPDFSKVNP